MYPVGDIVAEKENILSSFNFLHISPHFIYFNINLFILIGC